MYPSKDFLLLECDSVRSVLHETLRYEYGSDGSRDFFDECEVRLNFIKQEIEAAPPNDFEALDTNARHLIHLSALLSRIERSNIGEYSWPFVEELKKLANAVCTEATLTDPHSLPKLHVLSDGGLDKYAIYAERKRPTASERRILTIIFPRSLKHFVLLHPVLAHELGHAIWRGSEYEKELINIVATNLLTAGSIMENAASCAAWLYSATAPQSFKDALAKFPATNQANFFGPGAANWVAWVEELTCDLIGLLIFGPSFIAALGQLLYGLYSGGNGFSTDHPPVAVRINLMLTVATLLQFDTQTLPDPVLNGHMLQFWTTMKAKNQALPWYNPFSQADVQNTVNALQGFLAKHPPALYESPDVNDLQKLLQQLQNQTPPVGFEFDATGVPTCSPVDFRHSIYAGWIIATSNSGMSFFDINRLCEHGIMQQGAIDIFTR